ncbi:MAG: hypothetical protein J7480_07165 [Microbacteriaceae bacterium]|nr:hypothetical protein [Microbacteriaceae bacterium]
MPEKSELDKAAEWLDRLVNDRTAPGRVTVVAVNEVAPKPRYQDCRMTARIEAAGLETVELELEYMVRREYWPAVGDILPATVHLDHPERTEIAWERVPKRG